MNIKSVTIKNFRNFKDFSIDFSLGFQTIIGENNIGKSNLYWAIRLVLDKNLPHNTRNLEIKDFHGFKKDISIDDHIIISIELFSKDLSSFPTFHALKTSDNTARITYLFAHKSKFKENSNSSTEMIEISQFKWYLYAGGDSFNIEDIISNSKIGFSDLDGVNLYYINAFRNINSDLQGNGKSLLSKYCQSRSDAENELENLNSILTESSKKLNELKFIPNIAESIEMKGKNIAGKYFSFPVSISFNSNHDSDTWSQLNLYYNPNKDTHAPIQTLGLGQKNILYITLFIAELENSNNDFEINILLIEEPEAHLHPQLQKFLFSKLNDLKTTQVFMTSHSTHIASDCDYKNLNIIFKNNQDEVKSFSPFKDGLLSERENKLLKRYLDATRSEMFFASAIIYVEGVGEQFIIPTIAKEIFDLNFTENNISVIPIHSRYFDPYLKIVQDNNLEIPVVAIIDGDPSDIKDGESETTAVKNARLFEVNKRVLVSSGTNTLEIDLFPNSTINKKYLEDCFVELGHEQSYKNLILAVKDNADLWGEELIKRIDGTIKKGRFAQQLSLLIDKDFVVPDYIEKAISHIKNCKSIS